MKWTKQQPEDQGYYWIRNFRRYAQRGTLSPKGEVVEVFEVIPGKGLTVFFVGHGETVKVDEITAEWYGPIEPPE